MATQWMLCQAIQRRKCTQWLRKTGHLSEPYLITQSEQIKKQREHKVQVNTSKPTFLFVFTAQDSVSYMIHKTRRSYFCNFLFVAIYLFFVYLLWFNLLNFFYGYCLHQQMASDGEWMRASDHSNRAHVLRRCHWCCVQALLPCPKFSDCSLVDAKKKDE